MRATYQVQQNRTVRGPNGRFVARGVQMFPYLFVSNETRANPNFRQVYNDPNKGAASGISEPTGYARIQYVNHANVVKQLSEAFACGVNLIRVDVEPAVYFASVSYQDPYDGITYPSDLAMLDDIIDTAAEFGIVVQLQNQGDANTTQNHITFLQQLTARYWNKPNVWINPQNEIHGTTSDVYNSTVWAAEMRQYVQALRADVAGQPAGTKYLNPICIDAPGWGERVDLAYVALRDDPVFAGECNKIIQPHIYSMDGQDDFLVDQWYNAVQHWWQFRLNFALMIGEVGIDNFAGRYDAALDPGIPSDNATKWAQMQGFVTDFLTWCRTNTETAALNGVIGHLWYGYVPGLGKHDDNSMRRIDGSWTAWGQIYRDKYLSPAYSLS